MIYVDNNIIEDIFMYNVYSIVWDCCRFLKVILKIGVLFCNLVYISEWKLRNVVSKKIILLFEYMCVCFDFFEIFFFLFYNVVELFLLENSCGFCLCGVV